MTWAATKAFLAQRSGNRFGEAATYTHSGLGETISVATAGFRGPQALADVGEGFIADVVSVWVPEADLVKADATAVTPQREGTWTRYPGASNAETWTVVEVERKAAGWKCYLEKGVRPVPRR